jgi:hypothetical protein
MNVKIMLAFASGLTFLTACANTDIQPLTATSFKISTEAAPACGRSGARKVANQAAAIEVIRRGGDRFIFLSEDTDSRVSGVDYNVWTGFQTYNTNEQSLVVQMVYAGQSGYKESLSAKGLLGPNWKAIVAEGIPDTCTD